MCIVTCNLTATTDKNAWGSRFAELINDAEFKGLFAGFNPRLTVGEMRGKVLLLSRYKYSGSIVGGLCQDWSNDKTFDKQTKGTIMAADGTTTPLWTQDYYSIGKDLTGKDEAIRRMLDETAKRDLTASSPAWVFNYTAGYMGAARSDRYRENAERTNRLMVDYLKNPMHNAATGIIYMDYAGITKTSSRCNGTTPLTNEHHSSLLDLLLRISLIIAVLSAHTSCRDWRHRSFFLEETKKRDD